MSEIDRTKQQLLILMAIAMPLSFATWQALLNNFAIEQIQFDSVKIGLLQSVREVPGFLSFTVVFLLIYFREQPLALFSLLLLGIGTAFTGLFPTVLGLYLTTVLMSLGFHYFEAVHQSLTLQWTSIKEAPEFLGKITAAKSFAALISFALIYAALEWGDIAMKWIYLVAGGSSVVLGIYCWLRFPVFETDNKQNKTIVLRKRYWLWYALVFMSGARRQIFVVFAGFLMVEKFGFSAANISLLSLANMLMTIYLAPKIGRLIAKYGERKALIIEYIGIILVFVSYALATEAWMGVVLYILDHIFFAMAIAIKTYFQKIADDEDIASSTGVSFTISHIVALVIPAAFGYLYLVSSSYVFIAGAMMAAVSLVLACLVPHAPSKDNETLLNTRSPDESLSIRPKPAS